MMQIYIDAIQESRKGPAQYVLGKGLDLFRMTDEHKVVQYLSEGYNIKATCINGALEQNWRLSYTSEDKRIGQAFVSLHVLLSLRGQWKLITVHTQEFYDERCRREAVRMYVTLWKDSTDPSPVTVQITPLDKAKHPDEFKRGQEKAQDILDVLNCIPQDKMFLLNMPQESKF